MPKKALGLVVAVVVIAALAVGAYFMFGRSDKTAPSTSANTANSQAKTAAPVNNAVLMAKTDSSVGQYLSDPAGKALYTFGGDTSGVSNCSGGCLASWPAYQATSSSNLPTDVTVISRGDGTQQYAYKGMPLYYFVSDPSGQTTGDGVSDFHAAKP